MKSVDLVPKEPSRHDLVEEQAVLDVSVEEADYFWAVENDPSDVDI